MLFNDDYGYEEQKRTEIIKKHEFEEVEVTSEYMETHYFPITNPSQFKDLIKSN